MWLFRRLQCQGAHPFISLNAGPFWHLRRCEFPQIHDIRIRFSNALEAANALRTPNLFAAVFDLTCGSLLSQSHKPYLAMPCLISNASFNVGMIVLLTTFDDKNDTRRTHHQFGILDIPNSMCWLRLHTKRLCIHWRASAAFGYNSARERDTRTGGGITAAYLPNRLTKLKASHLNGISMCFRFR